MKWRSGSACLSLAFGVALLGSAGCEREPGRPPPSGSSPHVVSADGQPIGSRAPAPPPAAKLLSKNVHFEKLPDGRRRVLVNASVCLREGGYGLECLLCRRATKEHESILAADADARAIHAGLVAAGAEPGSPVRFEPKFQSPTGTPVRVTLQYEEAGRTKTVPAQHWVRDIRNGKELDQEWVFAGSVFYENPDEPGRGPIYLAAEDGAFICVTNVPTAMLDLPVASPKALEERAYAPFTERIPELGASVVVILEPAPARK
jgi:hypothetical protein